METERAKNVIMIDEGISSYFDILGRVSQVCMQLPTSFYLFIHGPIVASVAAKHGIKDGNDKVSGSTRIKEAIEFTRKWSGTEGLTNARCLHVTKMKRNGRVQTEVGREEVLPLVGQCSNLGVGTVSQENVFWIN